jgi:hypothetical protein
MIAYIFYESFILIQFIKHFTSIFLCFIDNKVCSKVIKYTRYVSIYDIEIKRISLFSYNSQKSYKLLFKIYHMLIILC